MLPWKEMCAGECESLGVSLEVPGGLCVRLAVENPPSDRSVMAFMIDIVSGSAKSNIGYGATGRVRPSRFSAVSYRRSATATDRCFSSPALLSECSKTVNSLLRCRCSCPYLSRTELGLPSQFPASLLPKPWRTAPDRRHEHDCCPCPSWSQTLDVLPT